MCVARSRAVRPQRIRSVPVDELLTVGAAKLRRLVDSVGKAALCEGADLRALAETSFHALDARLEDALMNGKARAGTSRRLTSSTSSGSTISSAEAAAAVSRAVEPTLDSGDDGPLDLTAEEIADLG